MRQLFLILAMVSGFSVTAQKGFPADSLAMTKRLTEFLNSNTKLDFKTVMEYTYPKLFELVPKEQMIELMESTFSNPTMKISMDSLRIDKIHPLFKYQQGLYAKVDYFMIMGMQFLDSTMSEQALQGAYTGLQSQYGNDKVRLNKAQRRIDISVLTGMAAMKDLPADEWTFINMRKDDPMMSSLVDAALLQQLESYK